MVDLEAIGHNMRAFCRLAGDAKVMAIVKADAYGHGVVPVARAALKNGAAFLGVAIPEEAFELRDAGIISPILILGSRCEDVAQELAALNISQTVFDIETLAVLEAAARAAGRRAKIHLKVETGMNRLGILPGKALEEWLDALQACPHIELEGMFTHFADADGAQEDYTLTQAQRMAQAVAQVRARGFAPIMHACNTAGILRFAQFDYDMVRAGIGLYGYPPVEPPEGTVFKPALTWRSEVAFIHDLHAGERISYNGIYTAKTPRRVATLPVGYADGYNRLLSNTGFVLIDGQRAPVIGRVCMDQCMVDVTNIPSVKVGDEAVLLGQQGAQRLDAEEMAQLCGTISYEILCNIGKRVPRVYYGE